MQTIATPYTDTIDAAVMRVVREAAEVRQATTEEDYTGTDYVVAGHRYQARIRDHTYMETYPNDITFRLRNQNHNASEVHRILNGTYSADRMIYGFKTPDGLGVQAWRIVSIEQLRERYTAVIEEELTHRILGNHDGSQFIAIDADRIPGAVVASSGFTVQASLW